jgi:hypothetical protein
MLMLDIGIQYAFLLQVVRHRVLRQKRRLEADFSADPFAFGVRRIRRMVAAAPTAILRAKVGALNLIELLDLFPGLVADCSRDVDFELQNRHKGSALRSDVGRISGRRIAEGQARHSFAHMCRSAGWESFVVI